MKLSPLLIPVLMVIAVNSAAEAAEDGFRTLVVRERATATLAENTLSFRVMKLRGYSIDIMLAGVKQSLKLGDSFASADAACTVVFHEISPETRIARFRTDCR